MIPFEFEFESPGSPKEAYDRWNEVASEGRTPLYYSGGTEIVTAMRKGTVKSDVVLDLKGIPVYCIHGVGKSPVNPEVFWIGGGVTLSELAEALPETLLAAVAGGIADHTVRNALTVGGNVCGRLAYREMALAFLTLEAHVVIHGAEGLVQRPMKDLFHKRLNLGAGEFLLGFELEVSILSETRFRRLRRQKQSQTDYPIVHTVVVRRGDAYQVAVSGVTPYVWFGPETSALLKAGPGATPEENAEIILNQMKPLASSDSRASAQYKLALLKADLVRFFTEFETDEPEGLKATKEKGALK